MNPVQCTRFRLVLRVQINKQIIIDTCHETISVQARRNRLLHLIGIWTSVPRCFPTSVRAFSLHPQHSPSRLRENDSGINRCNNNHYGGKLPSFSNIWLIPSCCCLCFIRQSRRMILHMHLLNHGLVRTCRRSFFVLDCIATQYVAAY